MSLSSCRLSFQMKQTVQHPYTSYSTQFMLWAGCKLATKFRLSPFACCRIIDNTVKNVSVFCQGPPGAGDLSQCSYDVRTGRGAPGSMAETPWYPPSATQFQVSSAPNVNGRAFLPKLGKVDLCEMLTSGCHFLSGSSRDGRALYHRGPGRGRSDSRNENSAGLH